jgi:hypothetical protein
LQCYGQPVSAFQQAVADVQPQFDSAANSRYITHPDRLSEAAHVEACVDRAVEGELDPTGYRALGRLTKFSPPGLGEYLAGKARYRPDDEAAAAAIADTTRAVMALGWLFCCTLEAAIAGRSARDIWDFWAGASLRDPLNKIVPRDLARLIHQRGAELLVAKLTDAGLKRRGPSRVGQIGDQIVQHGFYLRMVQTDEIHEEAFRNAVDFRQSTGIGDADGRWDWDAYAGTNTPARER